MLISFYFLKKGVFKIAVAVTKREFFRLVARKAGNNNPKVAEKWYEAIREVIIEELQISGECRLINLGKFYTQTFGGYDMKVPGFEGGKVSMYIEPRQIIKFSCSDNFKDDVNGFGVSHDYRKKVRKGIIKPTSKKKKLLDKYTVRDKDDEIELMLLDMRNEELGADD